MTATPVRVYTHTDSFSLVELELQLDCVEARESAAAGVMVVVIEKLRLEFPQAGAVPVAVLAAAQVANVHVTACPLAGVHKTQPCRLIAADTGSDDGGEKKTAAVAEAEALATGVKSALRFIARCAAYPSLDKSLYGATVEASIRIDDWLDVASRDIVPGGTLPTACAALDTYLTTRTFFEGARVSLADLAVLGQLLAAPQTAMLFKSGKFPNLSRWHSLVLAHPSVADVIATHGLGLGRGPTNPEKKAAEKKKDEGGSFEIGLKDAEMGKVVTRFPPEPSGYLHIGHAKAALMNEYFARRYKGKLIMRFDDTNPSKEKDEFVENILDDIKTLGIEYDQLTYTSDYFDELLEMGETMIRKGNMYVDNTPVDRMREERLAKIESASRNNSVEENLRLWKEMVNATEEGQTCAARMKMDMKSLNGCLRDPVSFRCNLEPHHRTGTKYKCYPTYDFACPYVDAIEGVTHALRSAEYNDRNPQFHWMAKLQGVRDVHIWEYSRLNLVYTVLSKRKLQWFVNEGIVEGWTDPRFPTVQGIIRRGLTVQALRDFIKFQGASRNQNLMEWDKIWASNKKLIDPVCPRHAAVVTEDKVMISLENGPASPELLSVPKHKKNADVGMKALLRTARIWVDQEDAAAMTEGEEVTLMDWGNAIIVSIDRAENGKVTAIRAKLHLEGDVKKTKLKLTWLADTEDNVTLMLCEFGYIITKPKPEENDEIIDIVNKDSRKDTFAIGDMNMRSLCEGDIVQIERKGYFRVDQPYIRDSKPAVLFKIPDGKLEKR